MKRMAFLWTNKSSFWNCFLDISLRALISLSKIWSWWGILYHLKNHGEKSIHHRISLSDWGRKQNPKQNYMMGMDINFETITCTWIKPKKMSSFSGITATCQMLPHWFIWFPYWICQISFLAHYVDMILFWWTFDINACLDTDINLTLLQDHDVDLKWCNPFVGPCGKIIWI